MNLVQPSGHVVVLPWQEGTKHGTNLGQDEAAAPWLKASADRLVAGTVVGDLGDAGRARPANEADHAGACCRCLADSTAVLGTKNDAWEGVPLTRDHKPNLKDEKQRASVAGEMRLGSPVIGIESNGGRVVFDGYANHRVYAKNGRYPGINMSRCIGRALPQLKLLGDSPWDADGSGAVGRSRFWSLPEASRSCGEFISPQEAIDKAQRAAETLAKEAWDRWIREEGGAVVDDITVILVYLKPT
eukprot:Skav215841  [mRNA]  locus=scaffold1630:70945:77027:- [translate_table: standard]